MTLLYACSLSLYIEGSQTNVLDDYSDNSIKEDTVRKWILNTAKQKKKNIDEADTTHSTDSTPNTMIVTISKKIIEERQQIDPEDEPVMYVDNPVEAKLPCRWISRSSLRELMKQRGKGNFISKHLEDLTKHCMNQGEMFNIRAKLHETTKDPILVVENPVEANIACSFISRSKLRTIILNRAKDNMKGIDKNDKNSVFFRIPIECARQHEEISQIKGITNTYFTRPSRYTCMPPTTQANSCNTRTKTTARKSFESIKTNAAAIIMMILTTPRNTFVPFTTRTNTYITSSSNTKTILGAPTMGAFVSADMPIFILMNDNKITQRSTIEPITSTTTYLTRSSFRPRNTTKSTILTASVDTDRPITTQINTIDSTVTSTTSYDTRSSISAINITEPTTKIASIDISKPNITQRNTFKPTISISDVFFMWSSTSPRFFFEPTTMRASLDTSRTKTTQRDTFVPTVTRTTTTSTSYSSRSSNTSRNTIEPNTMISSVDDSTPKTTQRNTFEPTVTMWNVPHYYNL
ncbi:mucin-2-like [Cydia fagiglandana]|uniref:mucin-2-like n=1 Tax=Cydia fagiglandana TaxID=1458189 RepID=UPI002FEE3D8B